tara:strand:+ start:629 stop:1414 length:786 start_codon:yes stop_codon:yes gene_type:complete
MAAKVNEPLPVSVIEEIAERFKIKHFSHSSLDLARNDLGLWALRYLFKVYDPGNAAMERGKSVEHGCYVAHSGSEFDDPIEEAVREFNKNTALGVNGEARDRERANIPLMVQQYIDLFDGNLPTLEGFQRRIEVEVPGCPIPVIGYTDFDFEDAVVDLKTTTRLPSAISAAHRRQGAIYSRASGNRGVDFIYLTPKKAARYQLENSDQDWLEVCETAHRLLRFLDKFETREEVASVVIPNFDTFYWSSASTRETAREVFGY